MNILITGSTGFIGSNLTKKLSDAEKDNLICIVRESSKTDILDQMDVRLYEADLRDSERLANLPKNIEVVCHLAAEADYSAVTTRAFEEMIDKNVKITENIFLAVIKNNPNLKKFIHFSSLASVGFQRGVCVDNQTTPRPSTFYGRMKSKTELIINKLCKQYNTPLVILRPSLVYGKNDYTSDFLNSVRLINKGIFPIFGDGNNIMSPLIYVDDLVEICTRFIKNDTIGTFICANNEEFTVNYFVKTIRQKLQKKRGSIKLPVWLALFAIYPIEKLFKFINKPAPLNKKRIIDLSVDRNFKNIHKDLDNAIFYHPTTELKKGADEAIDWYRENKLI